MSWQGIHGHDAVVERFRQRLVSNRLATTFLFVGPPGIGKRRFALALAKVLLCETRPPAAMDPCNTCQGCVQVEAETHPDLLQVARPADKSEIPVKLLIGEKERRMQEGLCHDIALKPLMGERKVAIIDDADFLNEEGANCLLKTLEEPPPGSVMILIGTRADRQLPTIRSRSQIIRFEPLADEQVANLLVEQGVVDDRAWAERLATYSEGSVQRARELADPELWKFRHELTTHLARPRLQTVPLARLVIAFVEEAGKEASLRRPRSRQVIALAAEFYRQLMRKLSGAEVTADAELLPIIERAAAQWPGDSETAAACADRCLDALEHVDRNANQAMMLEAWIDALGQSAPRGPGARV